MNVATIPDARRREALGEQDQLTVTGKPEAVAEAAWEPGAPSRGETPEWATTQAEVRGVVIQETSAPRGRSRELRDIAPARELARLLAAVRRWLRPRGRRTAPAGIQMAFTLPETPSPAEMTIIETPFRIPRYMDHPEWRPS